MFTDVKDTAVILRYRLEADAESLVFIIPLQPCKLRSGLVMGHFIQCSVTVCDLPDPVYRKPVKSVVFF